MNSDDDVVPVEGQVLRHRDVPGGRALLVRCLACDRVHELAPPPGWRVIKLSRRERRHQILRERESEAAQEFWWRYRAALAVRRRR